MALTDATIVLTKTDIEDPMERIFHAPGLPDGLSELGGITGQRSQEHALLDRYLPAHFAVRLDQPPTGDLGPRTLHPSALDIRRDPIGAGFQAPMIRVNGRLACRGEAIQP